MPDLFLIVRTCDDALKDFITWKLGTLVSIVRQVHNDVNLFILHIAICEGFLRSCTSLISVQHIRKYLPELLSLISVLWSSFSFPVASRPPLGYPVSSSIQFAHTGKYVLECMYFLFLF